MMVCEHEAFILPSLIEDSSEGFCIDIDGNMENDCFNVTNEPTTSSLLNNTDLAILGQNFQQLHKCNMQQPSLFSSSCMSSDNMYRYTNPYSTTSCRSEEKNSCQQQDLMTSMMTIRKNQRRNRMIMNNQKSMLNSIDSMSYQRQRLQRMTMHRMQLQQHNQQQRVNAMHLMKMKMIMMQKLQHHNKQRKRSSVYSPYALPNYGTLLSSKVASNGASSLNAMNRQYQNKWRMNRLLLLQSMQRQQHHQQRLPDSLADHSHDIPQEIVFDRKAIEDDDDLSTIVPPEECM